MRILFLHGWHSIPGGVKPTFLRSHGHDVSNPALPDDDFAEAAVWVDASPDQLFAPYLEDQDGRGCEVRNVAWLRQTLARWPRDPARSG